MSKKVIMTATLGGENGGILKIWDDELNRLLKLHGYSNEVMEHYRDEKGTSYHLSVRKVDTKNPEKSIRVRIVLGCTSDKPQVVGTVNVGGENLHTEPQPATTVARAFLDALDIKAEPLLKIT